MSPLAGRAVTGGELDVPGPQHPATAAPAGVTDSQLAVLLRQTQWALDDAAYDCVGGLTRQRREELAGTLEALAVIIRASAPEHPTQTPAGRRLSAPARLPTPGDRPDPSP